MIGNETETSASQSRVNGASGREGAAARDDRLKAALKANMARRKAQAKARTADDSDPAAGRQQETE